MQGENVSSNTNQRFVGRAFSILKSWNPVVNAVQGDLGCALAYSSADRERKGDDESHVLDALHNVLPNFSN